jgi:2-iminobutanoate/2-iminopropanoate deaminase
MKVERRDILKGLVAGTAGALALGFGTRVHARSNSPAERTFAKKPKYPVEPTTVTRIGDILFVSGIGCYEGERTIENHTTVVMKKLHKILEENGSHINRSLRCTAWIDDIANYGPMNRVYGPLGPNGSRGTRSCMAVPKGNLPGNTMLLVDCIARI